MCSLDILFLRPDKPQLFWAGDIDNRLKTLFDSMKIPDANEGYETNRQPQDDESPFFVLLEKDELITKISVETDQLLDFDGELTEASGKDVHLVITVRVRPYEMHLGNMQFG